MHPVEGDIGRSEADPWIGPDEPPAYELVNPQARGRAILVCDHASRRIPRRLGTLGLRSEDLKRHIAWDIGAAAVARRLASRLDAPLVLAGYSRLVVDCNRPLTAADAFATRSEDTEVPGNQNLSEQERAERAQAFFWPYQDAVHRLVAARVTRGVPVMVSVHSFTPVFRGQRRPWDIGVHYRLDPRLARLALARLRAEPGLCVGENQPYAVALDEDYTVPVHAETRGMPYVLFEIRQDHIAGEAGAQAWAGRLGALLTEALTHPSLAGYGARATDVHEPRYAEGDDRDAAK